jgi:hypothetical protein
MGRIVSPGPDLCEFGPEEEAERRVIDPGQYRHQGTGCAIYVVVAGILEINRQSKSADTKQNDGDQRPMPDIFPSQPPVRQELEYGDEQRGRGSNLPSKPPALSHVP